MEKLELTFDPESNFRVSEAYKVVRSNIMFLGSGVKALLFTSCTESEGKSTVSWNISVSLAESGKTVLYIDADMRKSVFSARHRIPKNTRGLSEFLSDQAKLNDIIYSTDKENLYVITAGPFPPNPSELLSGTTFADAIKVLKDTFDYIIVDAPPIAITTDPAVISTACDGSVLVISARKAPSRFIADCVDQLTRTGTPVVGSVLNMADYKYYSPTYKKYYGKYYYYSSSDGSSKKHKRRS